MKVGAKFFTTGKKHPLGETKKKSHHKNLIRETKKKEVDFKKYDCKDFAKKTLQEGSQKKNEL